MKNVQLTSSMARPIRASQFLGFALFTALAAACSGTSLPQTAEPQTTDGGACGQPLVGGTCKKPDGECEAEICVGTTWKCPDGDTAVALTPANCAVADGGID